MGRNFTHILRIKIPRILRGFPSHAKPPERAFPALTQADLHSAPTAAIQALQPDRFPPGDSFLHTQSPTAEAEASFPFLFGFWLSTFMSTKARTLAGTTF